MMEDARAAWENGLSDEMHFWDGIILGTDPRKEWVNDFVARMKGEGEFPEHLACFLEKHKLEDVKIIDVGAGPHTVLGPNFRGRRLAITAVDPLADYYTKLISRANLVAAIPTIMAEAETLSDLFSEEFDLVYSRNALDHSYNAPKAIEQMLKICKPGGYVFFEGASNEAVKQQFTGLHQWNFMPVDGDLVVWKINFHKSMRAYLTDYQYFSTVGTEWFQVTIRKNDCVISN